MPEDRLLLYHRRQLTIDASVKRSPDRVGPLSLSLRTVAARHNTRCHLRSAGAHVREYSDRIPYVGSLGKLRCSEAGFVSVLMVTWWLIGWPEDSGKARAH